MFEFGLIRDAHKKVRWTWPDIDNAICGCIILSIGPFYLTILKGDCKK